MARTRACSGEVDAGSPTRTCANQRIESMFRFRRNGTCARVATEGTHGGAPDMRRRDRHGIMITPDLVPAAMIAAAIAPALISLWLAVAADSRPEPARLVLVAVLLGALSAVLAGIVEVALGLALPVQNAAL